MSRRRHRIGGFSHSSASFDQCHGKIRRLWAGNDHTATDVKGTGGKKGHSGGFTPGLRWRQRTLDVKTNTLEICYISGKELVDHGTQVQTIYAPAGDVQVTALGNAVGSCE